MVVVDGEAINGGWDQGPPLLRKNPDPWCGMTPSSRFLGQANCSSVRRKPSHAHLLSPLGFRRLDPGIAGSLGRRRSLEPSIWLPFYLPRFPLQFVSRFTLMYCRRSAMLGMTCRRRPQGRANALIRQDKKYLLGSPESAPAAKSTPLSHPNKYLFGYKQSILLCTSRDAQDAV